MGKIRRKELRFLQRIKEIYPQELMLGLETAKQIKKELGKLLIDEGVPEKDKIILRKRFFAYWRYYQDELPEKFLLEHLEENPLPNY